MMKLSKVYGILCTIKNYIKTMGLIGKTYTKLDAEGNELKRKRLTIATLKRNWMNPCLLNSAPKEFH